MIDQVEVVNNGGLTLPAGARLSFTSAGPLSSTGLPNDRTHVLPAIPKGQRLRLDKSFTMALARLEAPAGGVPLTETAVLVPRIELLGRPFPESKLPLQASPSQPASLLLPPTRLPPSPREAAARLGIIIPVQFPVRLEGGVALPEALQPGEELVVSVAVRNISAKPYGGNSRRSLGRVSVMVALGWEERAPGAVAGAAVQQRQSWRKRAALFQPGEGRAVAVAAAMPAGALPYSRATLQVHLLLDGRSIEYRHQEIRVTPLYDAASIGVGGGAADAVLVTDAQLKQGEYAAWAALLGALGLSHACFDVPWQRRSSAAAAVAAAGGPLLPPSWIGRHMLVVYPHVPEDLRRMLCSELKDHIAVRGDPEGTAAVVGGVTAAALKSEMVDWSNVRRVATVSTKAVGGCCAGSGESREQRAASQAQALQRQLEVEEPAFHHVVTAKMARTSTSATLEAYKGVLPANFRLRALEDAGLAVPPSVQLPLAALQAPTTNLSASDHVVRSRMIGLDGPEGRFGRAFLTVAAALPLALRVKLILQFSQLGAADLPTFPLGRTGAPPYTFLKVLGIAMYDDLKGDWARHRDNFPHGVALAAELERLAGSGAGPAWPPAQPAVSTLMSGLVYLRVEVSSSVGRGAKAKKALKEILGRCQAALTIAAVLPDERQVREEYGEVLAALPGWWKVHREADDTVKLVIDS
eukprot:SM000296S11290  [mRNA]  locus=s296:43761:48350:+ [translate_table: standard]